MTFLLVPIKSSDFGLIKPKWKVRKVCRTARSPLVAPLPVTTNHNFAPNTAVSLSARSVLSLIAVHPASESPPLRDMSAAACDLAFRLRCQIVGIVGSRFNQQRHDPPPPDYNPLNQQSAGIIRN